MGWITLSLRKQVLTQRVSQLEHRLTKLSQEQQSLANSSSYAERVIGIEKKDAYSEIIQEHSDQLNTVFGNYSASSGASIGDLANYNVQLQEAELTYIYNQALVDSIFTQKEQALQDEVNTKQTYLELEQEQVETQLEAARAELEQLGEAISQDIKSSTISLT